MTAEIPLIRLDLRDETPLYDQIAGQMRFAIASGQVEPGAQLPTVRRLAQRLGVNFNTVARAYRILDAEGLILSRQGQGSFVSVPQKEDPQADVPPEAEQLLEEQTAEHPSNLERWIDAMRFAAQAEGIEWRMILDYLQTIESKRFISARNRKQRRTRYARRDLAHNPFHSWPGLSRTVPIKRKSVKQ